MTFGKPIISFLFFLVLLSFIINVSFSAQVNEQNENSVQSPITDPQNQMNPSFVDILKQLTNPYIYFFLAGFIFLILLYIYRRSLVQFYQDHFIQKNYPRIRADKKSKQETLDDLEDDDPDDIFQSTPPISTDSDLLELQRTSNQFFDEANPKLDDILLQVKGIQPEVRRLRNEVRLSLDTSQQILKSELQEIPTKDWLFEQLDFMQQTMNQFQEKLDIILDIQKSMFQEKMHVQYEELLERFNHEIYRILPDSNIDDTIHAYYQLNLFYHQIKELMSRPEMKTRLQSDIRHFFDLIKQKSWKDLLVLSKLYVGINSELQAINPDLSALNIHDAIRAYQQFSNKHLNLIKNINALRGIPVIHFDQINFNAMNEAIMQCLDAILPKKKGDEHGYDQIKKILQTCKEMGLIPIPIQPEKTRVNKLEHEPQNYVSNRGDLPPGTIVQVIRHGFKHTSGELIRPAWVAINTSEV